jgi:hypothetical protein
MEIDQNLSVVAKFLIHLLFPYEICKCNDCHTHFKHKSLKDLLMRADISTSKPDIGQCKGCGDRCCMTCKNIETAQKFQMGKNIP